MKTTLILGAVNDYHALHMLKACIERGLNTYLFDVTQYPSASSISWEPDNQIGCLTLNNTNIAFDDVASVFWSSIGPRQQEGSGNELSNYIAINDATSVLKTLFLEDSIVWCNSYASIQFHKIKPRQLARAALLGVRIPPTYIGNDGSKLKDFVIQQGETIFKPVYGGAHCATVSPEQLEDNHLSKVLSVSPVTIQKLIHGTNVRSYVLGNSVYSAELKSENLDYRIDDKVDIVPLQIPAYLESKAREITRRLGMRWTAIDWRRDKHGDYFFLEANPSPMFVHFEQQTGYPITADLVKILEGSKELTKC